MNKSLRLHNLLLSALVLAGLTILPAAHAVLDPVQVGAYTNQNTAVGELALDSLADGFNNTAVGFASLYYSNGTNNTGVGYWTLLNLQNGDSNTALGGGALSGLTNGNSNIAIGNDAGSALQTGDNNIHIGNAGVDGESDVIRIGDETHTAAFIAGISGVTVSNGAPVVVGADGQLGTGDIPPQDSYLQLPADSPAPDGYTKLGTYKMKYRNSQHKNVKIFIDLYQKD